MNEIDESDDNDNQEDDDDDDGKFTVNTKTDVSNLWVLLISTRLSKS